MSMGIDTSAEKKNYYKTEILKIGDGQIGRDLLHMTLARYKLIYIRTFEEDRVIKCIKHVGFFEGMEVLKWDRCSGLVACSTNGNEELALVEGNEAHSNVIALLGHMIDESRADHEKRKQGKDIKKGRIYVLLDVYELQGNPVLERKIKEFARASVINTLIVVSPNFMCPDTLNKEFTLVDFPFPSKEELGDSLDRIVAEIPSDYPQAIESAKKNREEIIQSVSGLTITEAENAFSKSLVRNKTFNIQTILNEKKQLIRKGGVLEYCDTTSSFDSVGGLDGLKEWLLLRKKTFSQEARDYGLPVPKGIFLAGVPGTGKSLICSALANEYNMPLLRLDMGSIFGSHVGESEKNMRLAIHTAEAVSPAILWIDEVEKGMGGVKSSNNTDGGTTNRVFGTLLTWMQEKVHPVFIVCTANNILDLPPEFFRRFDEIFFLDIPTADQRTDIVEKLIHKKKRDISKFDVEKIVKFTEHYTPAEIEKGIDNAMLVSFNDAKRDMTTEDIVTEMKKFRPIYHSRKEEIEQMKYQALGEDGKGGIARLANGVKHSYTHVENMDRNISINQSEL